MPDDDAKKAILPWSIKGVEPEARETAKAASRRAGLTLGAWLSRTIYEQGGKDAVGGADPLHRLDDDDEVTLPVGDLQVAERLGALERTIGESLTGISSTLQALNARLDALEVTQRRAMRRPPGEPAYDRETTITRLYGAHGARKEPAEPVVATADAAEPAPDAPPGSEPEAPVPAPAAEAAPDRPDAASTAGGAHSEPSASPAQPPEPAPDLSAPRRLYADDAETELGGDGGVRVVLAWIVVALILFGIGGFLYYALATDPAGPFAGATPAPPQVSVAAADPPVDRDAGPAPAETPEPEPEPADEAEVAAATEAGPGPAPENPAAPAAVIRPAQPEEAPAAAETPTAADPSDGVTENAVAAALSAPRPAASESPVDRLRREAGAGSSAAQFALASRHAEGDGVPRDLAKAARWYELAARGGLPAAQFNLGVLSESGQGVPQDPEKAVVWFFAAAEQGHREAQYRLAGLYGTGRGANRDYIQAARWYRRAAEQGHRDAQYNLGLMYARGVGVRQDEAEGYFWLGRAAAQGDPEAAQRQAELGHRLGDAQRAALDRDIAAGGPRPAPPVLAAAPTPTAAADDAEAAMVRRVQVLLARTGYDPGPADGLPGARTAGAVRAFQEAAGLTPDGRITPDLLRRLEAAAAR